MSAPETPSGDPISGRVTPVSALPVNVPISAIEPSPAPSLSQPAAQQTQPVFPLQPVSTRGSPAARPLASLQPLPRGRPPKPKSGTPPLAALWQHNSPQLDPASTAPVVQLLSQPLPQEYRKPPPAPAYVRGGHLMGGYNSARYPGAAVANPKFNPDGRVLMLLGADSLQAWDEQISYIARSLSCFDELTQRFTSFPPKCTVQLFICETRFAAAFRVLEASISGQVWAYMRVLGYSSIPAAGEGLMSPTPADCFEYAKLAASKITVPGTPEQPAEERKRMVHEILTAKASDYPSDQVYKKGIQWLRFACDSLIRQGDYELAQSMYDPLPNWAPKPPRYEEPNIPAEANGEVDTSEHADGHQSAHAVPLPLTWTGAANSTALNGCASTPAAPNPPKLTPVGQQKSNKRKRVKKEPSEP